MTKPSSGVKTYVWTVYDNAGTPREVSAIQKPITLNQKVKLAQAFRKVGLRDWTDLQDIKFGEVIDFVASEGILNDVLDAILVRSDGCTIDDLGELTYPVLKEVATDFLALNPELLKDLRSFASSRILSQIMTLLDQPSRPKK